MLQLASLSDRERVNDLARQVHKLHVQWRPDIFTMPAELYSEERILDAIHSRNLYVAKIGDAIIGYALLRQRVCEGQPGLMKRRIMFIEEICVEETMRGQGFGREMVTDIHALARAFRCTDLQLGVYPQNDAAVGFWQKCGFTIRSIEMQKKA